jgi:rRNA maturation RNase YbeY
MKNVYVTNNPSITIKKRDFHSLVYNLTKELNINIVFLAIHLVDQATIIKINKDYLSHNFSTDIITFGYSEDLDNIDAEIFISYIDAKINAENFSVSLKDEITRLIIHGLLHLVGYNDKEKNEKNIMKKLENKLLKMYSGVVKNPVHIK